MHIIIKMAKFKEKEKILKATKVKVITLKDFQLGCLLIFQHKHFRLEGHDVKYSR